MFCISICVLEFVSAQHWRDCSWMHARKLIGNGCSGSTPACAGPELVTWYALFWVVARDMNPNRVDLLRGGREVYKVSRSRTCSSFFFIFFTHVFGRFTAPLFKPTMELCHGACVRFRAL